MGIESKLFSLAFKEKVFKVFKTHRDLLSIMAALERQRINLIRFILEDSLDDSEMYNETIVLDEVMREVKLTHLGVYTERKQLYTEFMDILNEMLDVKEVKEEADGRLL
jgi:hypothetical protein